MGQSRPITDTSGQAQWDYCNLSDDQQQAMEMLDWIAKTLGKEDPMVPYFAAMVKEQIRAGVAERVGCQFASDLGVFTDASGSS